MWSTIRPKYTALMQMRLFQGVQSAAAGENEGGQGGYGNEFISHRSLTSHQHTAGTGHKPGVRRNSAWITPAASYHPCFDKLKPDSHGLIGHLNKHMFHTYVASLHNMLREKLTAAFKQRGAQTANIPALSAWHFFDFYSAHVLLKKCSSKRLLL